MIDWTRHFRVTARVALVAIIGSCAYALAFLLRFSGELTASYASLLVQTIGPAVALKSAAACWYSVHRGWSRDASFRDIVDIAKATALATVGITLLDAMVLTAATIPRSVILLDGGATLLLVASLRALPRVLRGRQIEPYPVVISELLRRPSVDLDLDQLREWLTGRTVMVTGSAGSIGSEICRQLMRLSPGKILLVDRSETGQFFLERELKQLLSCPPFEIVMADLADAQRLRSVFEQHRPEVIIHAAAYKHVPLMEAHPGEAVKNIVFTTRTLCDLADEFQAERFVMISTDKAVNPTSVMGGCKRLAEQYVQSRSAASRCRYITVRFGNVLDSAGSVVPIFREQIARGGPVTITHPDMVRYFMMIPEAAQLVLQAGGLGRGGQILVLDMGQPVRILDLARDMIRLSGLREGRDIEIRFTGTRPGEKLFEEVYACDELHAPTSHPKILASTVAPKPLLRVIADINRLESLVDVDNDSLPGALRDAIAPPQLQNDVHLRAA